jgi:CheY-like chemotaxis protein
VREVDIFTKTSAESTQPAKRYAPEPSTGPESHNAFRVLFVDDEETVTRICKTVLERKGCAVTASASSEEALAIFSASPNGFDVVLTDLSLPGMDGFALAEGLKQIRSDIPIVIMTGYGAADVLRQAQQVGVRHVLPKPIHLAAFTDLVQKVAAGNDDADFVGNELPTHQ